MAYVNIVTALAVLQFAVFGYKVGAARGRYGIKAPAISGHEVFERHFRVQQNTLEQLVMFLPSLYLFSRYFNPLLAAGLGLVYLVGRELYAASYVKDPDKREVGFVVTFIPNVILLGGGLFGAIRELI
ncbi:MAG: MAPEG family protein [Steroidobacterales bacterium]